MLKFKIQPLKHYIRLSSCIIDEKLPKTYIKVNFITTVMSICLFEVSLKKIPI